MYFRGQPDEKSRKWDSGSELLHRICDRFHSHNQHLPTGNLLPPLQQETNHYIPVNIIGINYLAFYFFSFKAVVCKPSILLPVTND